MPFALLIIGLCCVMSGVKGTQKQLGAKLVGDFTGTNNFLEWMVALVCVGAIGYIPGLEKLSRAFLALCLISIIVAHNGVFTQLFQAINAGPQAPTGAVSLSAQTQTAAGPQPGGIMGFISSTATDISNIAKIGSFLGF